MMDESKGMDEKIEAMAEKGESSMRQEDMGSREMSMGGGDVSQGMDAKIENAAEMEGKEEDTSPRDMSEGKM
jgi:hypothetical protein